MWIPTLEEKIKLICLSGHSLKARAIKSSEFKRDFNELHELLVLELKSLSNEGKNIPGSY